MKQLFQFVTLTFSDGTKADFVGRAVIFEGAPIKSIVRADFTEPEESPTGEIIVILKGNSNGTKLGKN